MFSLVQGARRGLARFLHPAGGAEAWRERLSRTVAFAFFFCSLALAVLARVLLGAARFPWPAYQGELTLFTFTLAVWAVLLVLLAVTSRLASPKLLGPVLFYDLIRIGRRVRFVVIRLLYALLLTAILFWLFYVLTLRSGWTIRSSDMASFANSFFYTFLSVQFFTIVVLTPAYTAGAVAEEKERKTIHYILSTDLRGSEIVLGKLVSRIFNLTMILLAGLPILAFLQFLGGVDPLLVFDGFAVTALTMFSLAGLSMYNSVMMRRSRDAIVLTYLGFLAYHMIALLTRLVYWPTLGWSNFPQDVWPAFPFTVGDLSDWFNSGNIGYGVYRLMIRPASTLDDELPWVVAGYALFHGLLGLVLIGQAMRKLRPVALEDEGGPSRAARPARRPRPASGDARKTARKELSPRLAVRGKPMVWKEVYGEGGMRLNSFGRILIGVLVAVTFLPTFVILWFYLEGKLPWTGRNDASVQIMMNIFQVRIMGTIVASLMLLAVVVRAANSICGERERDTLDGLLTTPLDTREILYGKWVGAVFSVRWGWLWLGLVWGVGVLTGGLHPLAVPLLAITWFVYATFLAGLGLWFSAAWKRTFRATVAALAATIFLGGGHWLVTLVLIYLPLSVLGANGAEIRWPVYIELGHTPPVVLGMFAMQGSEFEEMYNIKEMVEWGSCSLIGVALWAAAVFGLWYVVLNRFRKAVARDVAFRPDYVLAAKRRAQPPKDVAR